MLKLTQQRAYQPGLPELLPWAALVGNGLVLAKRGALVGGFYFRPPDAASETDDFQALISLRVREALNTLGTNWSTWADVVVIEAPDYPPPEASHFPDPVSRAVDDERRTQFMAEGAHFENERIFLISYEMPHTEISRVEEMMYSGGKSETLFARLHAHFEQALRQIDDHCGDLIGLRRMQSYEVVDSQGRTWVQDELVNYLNYIVTGDPAPIMLPPAGNYLDVVLGGLDFEPGEVPVLGDEYLCCLTIEGFPAEHLPNITARLNGLTFPYRFSQRAIYLDPEDAIAEINKYKRQWSQKAKSIFAFITQGKDAPDTNEHAVSMRTEATSALALAESRDVVYLFYTAVVVLRHEDPEVLKHRASEVKKALRDCGLKARIETTNTTEAWRGTHPGDIVSNVRRPLIHTANLADLLPLSGVWSGEALNPCRMYPQPAPALFHAATEGAIPFRFNLHVGDLGHTLVFGPTNAGKSTLTAFIALQALRYPGMFIWALDYKRGMFATAKACGGNHVEMGGQDAPQLCPLGVLDTPAERLWAKDWVETCCHLQMGRPVTPAQAHEIELALDVLSRSPDRSLTQFCLQVQDEAVREAMRAYTLRGSAGYLLDAQSDSLSVSHFNVFELIDLMDLSEKIHLPVLLYLFRRFERQLDGRPALLFIAEAWVALGHPAWRGKVKQWLKTLRSKNCAVVMDTQSLSDAVRSGILDILIESCATTVYLPNASAWKTGTAEQPGPLDLYRAMQLNDRQIHIIHDAPKHTYYVTSAAGCRLIHLALQGMALDIAGATSETDIKRIKALIAEHGDDWLQHHCAERRAHDHAIAVAA